MIKSDSLNELAAALSKAQGEMRDPEMDAKNPFYKSEYTTLGEVLRTIRPVLNKFGLSVTQGTQVINTDATVLETTLLHSSGQFLTHQYPILPVKSDPQGLGSAITYARRYSLKAILGLAEADDDGNEHVKEPKQMVEKIKEAFPSAKVKTDNYVAKFGKYKDKEISTVNRIELLDYCDFLKKSAKEQGKELSKPIVEFITAVNDLDGNIPPF